MFWNTQWYGFIELCAFYALIVLNIFCEFGTPELDGFADDARNTFRKHSLVSIGCFGAMLIGGLILLVLQSAIESFFWPISMPYLLRKANNIRKKRAQQ